MGIYREKKEQLIEKIEFYKKRIADDTAKKKAVEDKLKEMSRLAMAEEYNCKPRELDEIISSEHSLLQKLRASGLSDAELLELVGIPADDNGSTPTDDNVKNADIKSADSSDSDKADSDTADDSTEDDDEIRFYGEALTDYN